jgi:hypothetical protein
VRFLSARILVEAGAVAKARPIAASLASELATEPQAYGKIIAGEIALKEKDLPQAIKILTEANALVDTWVGPLRPWPRLPRRPRFCAGRYRIRSVHQAPG